MDSSTTEQIIEDLELLSVSKCLSCSPESCGKFIRTNNKTLTVLQVNIRSINRNFGEFLALLARIQVSCDVLVLTECWLSKLSNLPELENYVSYKSSFSNQNDWGSSLH